jgi:hypothetical protein
MRLNVELGRRLVRAGPYSLREEPFAEREIQGAVQEQGELHRAEREGEGEHDRKERESDIVSRSGFHSDFRVRG